MLYRFRDTHYFVDEQGRVYNSTKGKFIKLYRTKNGYLTFRIHYRAFRVHRVVYEAITKKVIKDGYEIDHIDKNRTNNNISNLRCLTKFDHQKVHRVKSKTVFYFKSKM